jgi:hypothetical protein
MWTKLKEYGQNPTKLHVIVKEQINVGVFLIYPSDNNSKLSYPIFTAWYLNARYVNPWAWLNEHSQFFCME